MLLRTCIARRIFPVLFLGWLVVVVCLWRRGKKPGGRACMLLPTYLLSNIEYEPQYGVLDT